MRSLVAVDVSAVWLEKLKIAAAIRMDGSQERYFERVCRMGESFRAGFVDLKIIIAHERE
jgi:hypothetical protein